MIFRTPISSAFTLSLFALMAVSTKGDFGCYNSAVNQCSCENSVCTQATCEGQGATYIWTGGCGTCSCLCPDTTSNTFTVKVDLFAGALGYFSFHECGDVNPNPTLQMKVGEVYTFDQTDISNYYHPMGFAYNLDGALTDSPELEPGVPSPNSTSGCNSTLLCPAPIYFKNGEMLESYTNLDDSSLNGNESFGLDLYEPEFFYPLVDWLSNEYTIKLRYNDETVIQDFFYFCHIHEGMSGRIILLDDEGNQKNGGMYEPKIPRGYYDISNDPFDNQCGTHNLAAFTPALNADSCPQTFVCNSEAIDSTAQDYAECIDAMNCAMMLGMTTNAGESPSVLFLQQMIPHHANAVQMAKSLLKVGELDCGDDYEEETSVCILEGIAREIITNQNFQIQTMIGLYEEETGGAYEDSLDTIDCDVKFQNSESPRQPGICFSAFTTAFVNGKGSVTMDLIEVGDSVLTGNGEFQSVYSIDHRDINKSTTFLQIAFGSDNNVLEITPNHMIFKEGSDIPVASATVTVGDRVATPSGYEKVNSVKTIERKGVFNPLTADGTIVASGMVASTFSSLLNQSESIEISGSSIMSYQQFFTNLLKPYKFFCTTLSLELCRVDSGKVMVSGLASRIFFFHYGDSAYQASLLSTIAFLLSIMEKIVIPLLYISIPLGICKLVSAGKK